MHAGFSPNGQFIAFISDESGRDEVYIQNFPDATMRRKVSTGVAVPVQLKETSADLGNPRPVMRLIAPPALFLYPYDLASDGRILSLALVPGAAANISLNVLVDWQAAWRR